MEADGTKTYTEEDWPEAEKVSDLFAKSKVVAEKTAWDFIKELPGISKLKKKKTMAMKIMCSIKSIKYKHWKNMAIKIMHSIYN